MKRATLPFVAGGILLPLAVIQMAGAQNSGPPPPPPPPPGGGTLVPPSAPGATATPLPTATAIPLTLTLKLAHGTVAPGKKQKVTVSTLDTASVRITVRFPNGYRKSHTVTVGTTGKASWSFVQPGSRITRHSNVARVSGQAAMGGQTIGANKRYKIAFGRVDLNVSPHKQKVGHPVTVWAHSYGNARITLSFSQRGHTIKTLPLHADKSGWTELKYLVPSGARHGPMGVRATVPYGHGSASARTSFRVK